MKSAKTCKSIKFRKKSKKVKSFLTVKKSKSKKMKNRNRSLGIINIDTETPFPTSC